jgi:uncharacterized membrane protein YgcG
VLPILLSEERVVLGEGRNLRGIMTEEEANDIVNKIIVPKVAVEQYAEGILYLKEV